MADIITRESLAQEREVVAWPQGFRFEEHVKLHSQGGVTVAEYVGASSFADEFYERQLYEVDAGRAEEPLLYLPIYNVIQDGNLPEVINVNTLGPFGVIFEQVLEGGEAKFVTVGEGTKSISMVQYAAALEYTKKLIMFNQTWNFALAERGFGLAFNALMNHIHLYPIISYAYAAANQTAASTDGTTLAEKYLSTIEDAIVNSRADTSNPRRGPYDLLVSTGDLFIIERALNQRIQDGANPARSSAIGMIQNVIAYDGATVSRGKLSTTYTGVTAGTGYLISKQYGAADFQSYVKQPLQAARGDGDLSRFIVEQVVYDWWGGVYCNPIAAVEEITWPS
jgi:hypothetical protein